MAKYLSGLPPHCRVLEHGDERRLSPLLPLRHLQSVEAQSRIPVSNEYRVTNRENFWKKSILSAVMVLLLNGDMTQRRGTRIAKGNPANKGAMAP